MKKRPNDRKTSPRTYVEISYTDVCTILCSSTIARNKSLTFVLMITRKASSDEGHRVS